MLCRLTANFSIPEGYPQRQPGQCSFHQSKKITLTLPISPKLHCAKSYSLIKDKFKRSKHILLPLKTHFEMDACVLYMYVVFPNRKSV